MRYIPKKNAEQFFLDVRLEAKEDRLHAGTWFILARDSSGILASPSKLFGYASKEEAEAHIETILSTFHAFSR